MEKAEQPNLQSISPTETVCVASVTRGKVSRKEQILMSLAHMLENSPGERITTARLAQRVGVSEAALYRHFPSKAKMFEALIEFIEETLFSRITRIINDNLGASLLTCQHILTLLLLFCEKNPGLTRILTGDALSGETDRLHARVTQLLDRLETQVRHVLRDAEIKEGARTVLTQTATANMLLAVVEGRIGQFVRSRFRRKPSENWQEQWQAISTIVFR